MYMRKNIKQGNPHTLGQLVYVHDTKHIIYCKSLVHYLCHTELVYRSHILHTPNLKIITRMSMVCYGSVVMKFMSGRIS